MSNHSKIRRPTSIDVARLAGVSQTTVSKVMASDATYGISEQTRARVLQAIDQLDYQPHEAARSLRSQSSRIIGMALPEAYNMHFYEMAMGAQDYAKSKNYGLFFSITNFDLERDQLNLQWLKQKRYDGLILISQNKKILDKDLQILWSKGYTVTVLGYSEPDRDSVYVNTNEGVEALLQHLIELGHHRIGYIYGVADQTLFAGRLNSCLEMQKRLGVKVQERYIRRCGPAAKDGYDATLALLEEYSYDERPTALIVVNDLLAGAVLTALHTAGISVPTQMSVASFDNTPGAAYIVPPLTTVDSQAYTMGAEGARLTIERLYAHDRLSEQVMLHSKLIIRESTGPASN